MVGFPLEGHIFLEAIQFGQYVLVEPVLHLGQFQYGTGLICQLWQVMPGYDMHLQLG